MPNLDLFLLPQHAPPERLADTTVIVVDLLRASTTICTALANGAECVMPFAEIDATLAAAEHFGRHHVLLGGERHGKLIPGFDLSNSPAEYTPERVAGRRILFTTTNGARAIHHARGARRVLVGAAANRSAVARAAAASQNVVMLCAGTDGEVANEDVLAAGAIVERMADHSPEWSLTSDAKSAVALWQTIGKAAGPPDFLRSFVLVLECTQGGRNLHDIGRWMDIERCAHLDTLTVVPELNPATGELRPA